MPKDGPSEDGFDAADEISDKETRDRVLWLRELRMLPPWDDGDPPGTPPVEEARLRRYIDELATPEESKAILDLILRCRSWHEAYLRLLPQTGERSTSSGE